MSQIQHNAALARFEMEVDGQLSLVDYRLSGDVMAVTHVFVPESQRGQGLAGRLAAGVVEYARREKLKIRPVCPYMAAYLRRHPADRDVLENG